VSSSSSTSCVAVGDVLIGDNGTRAVAQRWDGRRWYAIRPTTPGLTLEVSSGFSGVSCASATACTAVGADDNGGLVERWNGSKWSIQRVPAAVVELDGVACTSAKVCTSVGWRLDRHRVENLLLAARWNGSSWSLTRVAEPRRFLGTDGFFAANFPPADVSCTSPGACMAVWNGGRAQGADVSFTERWNGHRWSIKPTATPNGASDVDLDGVSCRSKIHCIAVGTFDTAVSLGTATFLAESWNGNRWSIQSPPSDARA
jgi:hypothetical protein